MIGKIDWGSGADGRESNGRPAAYKAVALPTELRRRTAFVFGCPWCADYNRMEEGGGRPEKGWRALCDNNPMNTEFIKEVGPLKWATRTAIRQFYKRVIRRDHWMRLPTGKRLSLPFHSHFASEAYVTKANVDWGSEKLLYALLPGNGAFLDVGAHIGYYALYMLPRVDEVYCFEPDTRILEALRRNARRYNFVHVIPAAAGATNGKARFAMESSIETSHLSDTGTEIDVVTLDAFVQSKRLRRVTAIKTDAEGHDLEVLQGAVGVLREHRSIVLTEAKPESALFDLMETIGYAVFGYAHDGRKPVFMEIKRGSIAPTKMLFLVSEGMRSMIISKARELD